MDMIMTYKILHKLVDVPIDEFFSIQHLLYKIEWTEVTETSCENIYVFIVLVKALPRVLYFCIVRARQCFNRFKKLPSWSWSACAKPFKTHQGAFKQSTSLWKTIGRTLNTLCSAFSSGSGVLLHLIILVVAIFGLGAM